MSRYGITVSGMTKNEAATVILVILIIAFTVGYVYYSTQSSKRSTSYVSPTSGNLSNYTSSSSYSSSRLTSSTGSVVPTFSYSSSSNTESFSLFNAAWLTYHGGIGGQIFSTQVCSSAYGGTAYAPPYLYVPCIDGLVALRLSTNLSSFAVTWRAPSF